MWHFNLDVYILLNKIRTLVLRLACDDKWIYAELVVERSMNSEVHRLLLSSLLQV